ncbi:MAG: hypothetical protein QW094_07380 [Candidatus Caldarchaeum sp.]
MLLHKPVPNVALATNTLIRVPEDVPNLQSAIQQVPDQGVIDIAPGVYQVPSGGLFISNLGKSFTIRSRTGVSSSVILSGANAHPVLKFMNSSRSLGGRVTFEGITFADGVSNIDGIAGGVTLQNADAVFLNCQIINNKGYQPNSGGGGAAIGLNSRAAFVNCAWKNNVARLYGGGLAVGAESEVDVIGNTFEGNSTSIPNHAPTSAGGGVHVSNSSIRLSDSIFRNNSAGYVGGGLYAIGTWSADQPKSRVSVVRVTFEGNTARRHPSVSFPYPTEGGALHAEDNSLVTIYRSYFFSNTADAGGGVNLYRASVSVSYSYFKGNAAVGVGSANGFGGAIAAISNDTPFVDELINRPSARLTVKDTVIHGGRTSQAASGIYIAGDTYRQYGTPGLPAMPGLSNRAEATLERVIIYDTDVTETGGAPGTGVGGGIVGDLAKISATDLFIVGADAFGSNSSGGGIALLNNSLLEGRRLTLAYNTSQKFGAAFFVQGSEIYLFDCKIYGNEVSPGVSEDLYASYGSAIFSAPDYSRGLPTSGQIKGCLISDNPGLLFFEDDNTAPPYNLLQYNDNRIYTNSFSGRVYRNSTYTCCLTVEQLNSYILNRPGIGQTAKSVQPNIALATMPPTADLYVLPPAVFPSDPLHFLAFAWSGSSAMLNEESLSKRFDLLARTTITSYTMNLNNGQIVLTRAPGSLVNKAFLPSIRFQP